MPACSGGVACVGMTPVELEDSDSDVTEEEKVTVKVGRDLKFHYPALFSYKRYIEVRKKYCFDDRSTVYKHPTKKLEVVAAGSRVLKRPKSTNSNVGVEFPKLSEGHKYSHYNKSTKLCKVHCRTCKVWVGHVKMTFDSYEVQRYNWARCRHSQFTVTMGETEAAV